ncbi:hypothetical protein BCF74_10329 [Knoellia remsis]|uniref:TY-Chap N-terminal domain-containing protein n=1 Tax=Knoellia remsis TaxID=407159 RepID=A0A2T0UY30_9MICO|nr:hypothetical protein [Knoellia remsis]PRY62822.1 hypothetical protein BCF74_10329 [Knoellia remsis]
MTYAVELPAEGPADWGAWSRDLAHRIRALGPEEDVVISVPSVTRPHEVRASGFFGLVPARHEDTSPWVRVRRDEDHAIAELVGSESFGGDFLFAELEEQQVEALGWRAPGGDPIEDRVWSRWFPDDVTDAAYLPLGDARAAADLVTATLRLLLD